MPLKGAALNSLLRSVLTLLRLGAFSAPLADSLSLLVF